MRFGKLLAGMALSLLAITSSGALHAASYPERGITIVVPWPPGGFTDRLGRMLAEKLSASLGQPVIVDNRPGASGGIGAEIVMRAAPDGYTLLVSSTDVLVKLMQGKGTDPLTLTSITMLAAQPVTLSVGPKFKGDTLKAFIEAAKADAGGISYASNGEGGATHFGMEIFARMAGVRLNHVPYKGTAPALSDLIGGQVDATLVSVQGIGAYLKNGRARALAITAPKRVDSAPDVPTFAEAGFPEFDLTLWYGMAGPRGMPEAIVRRLNEALNAALTAPDVQQQLRSAAAEPMGGTVAAMDAFMQKEAARWKTMIP